MENETALMELGIDGCRCRNLSVSKVRLILYPHPAYRGMGHVRCYVRGDPYNSPFISWNFGLERIGASDLALNADGDFTSQIITGVGFFG